MLKRYLTVLLIAFANSLQAQQTIERGKFPVVLLGSEVPSLIGTDITKIYGYKYTGQWIQIPFQIDERTWVDFSKKRQPGEEYRYLPGDSLLDENDELVFMISDMGMQAPGDSWVTGADRKRVEVKVTDPLNGNMSYLYIYTGNLNYSAGDYVDYSRIVTGEFSENTTVTSPFYQARYIANWVWDNLYIKDNGDMIDRLKYRVYGRTQSEGDGFNETEEYWSNGRSTYIGDKDGPVRVIRMVEGAASGPNTTYHAKWYKNILNVEVNYRVHGIPDLWVYFDYKTDIPMSVYNVIDSNRSVTKSWAQGSTDIGSIITWFDVSELAAKAKISEKYYLNDPGFDDETGEDGSAYENMGIHLYNIENLEDTIGTQIRQWIIFLPENAPEQGSLYDQVISNPVSVTFLTQQNSGGFVDITPPVVSVNSPAGGEVYYLGDSVNIQFSAQDDIGVDSIYIDLKQTRLAELSGAETSYVWIANIVSDSLMITVTARDSSGNTNSDSSGYFAVRDTTAPPVPNQPPVAVAKSDKTTGSKPLTVRFDGSGSYDNDGTISSYAWDFGDGVSSNKAKPIHTYTQVGTFTAVLTVTDDDGAIGTDQVKITVTAAANMSPTATITSPADGTNLPVGGTVTYRGTGTDPEDGELSASAFTWYYTRNGGEETLFISGVTSGEERIDQPGTYTIILEVVDSDSASDRDQVTIIVGDNANTPPTAVAEASPTSGSAPLTVSFTGSNSTDSDGSISSYSWDFGDGTSSGDADPTHTYAAAGTYSAVLTVTDDDGATDTDQVKITVTAAANTPPKATIISPVNGAKFSVGENISYSGTGTDAEDGTLPASAFTWKYSRNGGPEIVFKTGVKSGSATATAPGNYRVILIVEDNKGLTGRDEVSITVSGPAKIAFAEGDGIVDKRLLGENFIPDGYSLSDAYPNPFNPTTSFQFSLPQGENVTLIIYNSLGMVVRNLLNNATLSAGTYTYRWNGRDDHGSEVTSGTYYLHIVAGPMKATKKLSLLK